jgi:hypothetical protein
MDARRDVNRIQLRRILMGVRLEVVTLYWGFWCLRHEALKSSSEKVQKLPREV